METTLRTHLSHYQDDQNSVLYSTCINICPHGTSTVTGNIWRNPPHQKDTVYLAIEEYSLQPSHRRQEERRAHCAFGGFIPGTFTPSSIIVGRRQHHARRMRAMENRKIPTKSRNHQEMYVRTVRYVRYIQRDQPAGGWSRLGRLARQKQPHTKKQRQPWRTKRTSPTYARRGRRSWASWDVPRPSYLPVSSEGGKDRLTRIPCCSTFGNLHPVVRSGSVHGSPLVEMY